MTIFVRITQSTDHANSLFYIRNRSNDSRFEFDFAFIFFFFFFSFCIRMYYCVLFMLRLYLHFSLYGNVSHFQTQFDQNNDRFIILIIK